MSCVCHAASLGEAARLRQNCCDVSRCLHRTPVLL
jgi:hypothetical protein